MNFIGPPIFVLLGLRILLKPSFYWEKYGIDVNLTGIHWILGPAFVMAGFYWVVLNKRAKKEKLGNLVCPECKQSYPIKRDASIEKCPKCQIDLLTLDEFLGAIKKK
ncbi:MAG: hypothetical protein GY865_01860 [candidate division Zixibacteria bacterium]|nr:hypothetical protein [candidate division Zixibacteria bacterium]